MDKEKEEKEHSNEEKEHLKEEVEQWVDKEKKEQWLDESWLGWRKEERRKMGDMQDDSGKDLSLPLKDKKWLHGSCKGRERDETRGRKVNEKRKKEVLSLKQKNRKDEERKI